MIKLSTLPRDARDTLFLLVVIALIVLPQIGHLPWWCSALTAAVLVWRGTLAVQGKPLPGKWWRVGLLLVTLAGAGAQPDVEVLRTGQFRWQQLEPALAVDSDLQALLAQLDALGADDVLQLRPRGSCDLAGHRRLTAALEAARARTRALVWSPDALRLAPTQDDLDALQADGFVGEVLQALRAEQAQVQAGAHGADGDAPEDASARRARDALLALARILDAQRSPSGANA